MGFDEPKPFVYATRDFREHISGISILQLVRLINGLADFVSEGGQRLAVIMQKGTGGNRGNRDSSSA